MNNINVSIIIPTYNVENYIEACLDSIINQTIKEIEIICIDDCSTDNTYNILEEYSKKDDRIIILKNKKNSGAGFSRNRGLDISKGEYIGFIDSDDYVSNNYFENLYNTAKKFNSDIVNNINMYDDFNSIISPNYYNINNISNTYIEYESNANIYNIDVVSKDNITYTVWNKIFNKNFLIKNKLSFMESATGSSEDVDFIIRVMLNNPKISFNNVGKHFYRKRENSSIETSTKDIEYWKVSIMQMENAIEYTKKNNPEFLDIVYIKTWHCPYYLFSISNEINKKNCYKYLREFANSIHIRKELYALDWQSIEYIEFLLIKSNETYEQYKLQKELFDNINHIYFKINQLENKINQKFRLFGIENKEDRKIIYIFGIKITIKKKTKN
ncbi:glycosyltransferase/CDP-glycerol:poly(glycerophosphate) glycerophosphotransferase [Brachyspira pilosicoli]|uniref:glycosyltransferase family 2 protein n=1 Tax=Brachyspira pilosicoli TaxID=52584 RepID=UPI000E146776|nr:glycosyltransferase family 2 protein [Brachyspira pilosicoli]SUW08918.1 glycosyltransferase/CDP-glycerol:poly(glycerophosphate) glycerophosphotransferase [Brachyspira pilosicoli]